MVKYLSHRGVAQLVARDFWEVEAAGSNPVTPIHPPFYGGFFIFHNVKAD